MSKGNTRRRKRPVYLVVLPTGLFVDGEEAEIIVGIRQTAAGADTLIKNNPGAIRKKSFLVDE